MSVIIQKNNSNKKNNKGFAMLFAVLTSSLLVSIGVSILGISLKEIQIATSARDSQTAYYAADSARECALYWDIKQGAFPACFDSSCSNLGDEAVQVDIKCNGQNKTLTFSKQDDGVTYQSTNASGNKFFKYSTSNDDLIQPEADVYVSKEYVSDSDSINTIIQTQGHNTGVVGRRVERGIRQINNSNQ